MSMSLKEEIQTWANALQAYDEEDFEKSLQLFSAIADNSKILTNMGLIYATLGEHEAAVQQFIAATELDQYLAIAYFQCGVSNFLLNRFDLSLKDFDEALLYLRGNQNIDYEQLGLKFKLYSAEVLFNKGLSNLYLGNVAEGLADMEEAKKEKASDEHNVIDDAIADRGEGYTVFSIPVGVLYRPSENKLKNAKTKDFLGKAKLVATSDESDAYTTFTGVTRLKQGISPAGVYLNDAPAAASNLSRSVTVAVTSRPSVPDVDSPKPANLQRSKTTINVPSDAQDRIRAASNNNSGSSTPSVGGGAAAAAGALAVPGLARSATSASGGRSMAGPVRGLSVRNKPATPPAVSPTPGRGDARLTDFYDDYIDSYGEEPAPPLPAGRGNDRVANWARNNAQVGPNPAVQRSRSMAGPPSAYGGSNGSMRRRPTKRVMRAPSSRAVSTYEEEEEGYVSGDYDEVFEMNKIRVKMHYQDDVRGMAMDANMPFEEFLERVTSKFGKALDGLGLKFKDEDGGKVTLRDEMDYELAIETARESAKGKPEGRLEIWCTDA